MSGVDVNQVSDSFGGRVLLALGDIKLAHSVFALPFAVLGAFLVAPRELDGDIDWGVFVGMLGLIVVCMFFARSWAMLVNRVADAKLDSVNERTKGRVFASGALSSRDGVLMLGGCGFGFVVGSGGFGVLYENWWPLILSVPVLVWIGFYSFTKRFTWLCHVFLGGALAASPIAAGIAVNPVELLNVAAVFWLAGMVLCWVAGFDVVYALQDMEHDRGAGINSMPARFGWRRAIWVSRGLHLMAMGALVVVVVVEERLGVVFGVGVGATGGLLVWEHVVLTRRGKAGIPMAFFTLNGMISLVLGGLGVLDIVVW